MTLMLRIFFRQVYTSHKAPLKADITSTKKKEKRRVSSAFSFSIKISAEFLLTFHLSKKKKREKKMHKKVSIDHFLVNWDKWEISAWESGDAEVVVVGSNYV